MKNSTEKYEVVKVKKTYFYFECCDKCIIDNLEYFKECKLISEHTFKRLENELKYIRICLVTDDIEPLFEKNRFYSNFKEIEKFYNANCDKYYLIITDNNDNTYTFKELKKIVFESKKLNKRTTSTNTYDEDGFCWAGNYCF